MAEAHSAVGFQFTVTPDGVDIDFNRQAFSAVLTSSRRSWRKRLIRFLNRYYAGVYPARAESYALCLAVFLGFDKGAAIDLSRGYVKTIEAKLPSITGQFSKFLARKKNANIAVKLRVELILIVIFEISGS